jgi:hypothetical protein
MITIRNSFTSNETTVRASVGDVLSPSRVRSIRRRMQASDCKSGGNLGERGPQDFAYDIDSQGYVTITQIAA